MLVPSLTVIVPRGGIPRVRSEVVAESGTVPVPVAGAGPEEREEPEELELDEDDDDGDDDVELPDWACCNALCIAAVRAVLTRSSAVLFAMLARPLALLDMALPIAVISALLAAEA